MVKMEILKSRDEWLKKRSSYIGGSDAAAVIGRNPWLSNTELWEIKTGRRKQADISDKPFVQYGIKAEDHIRELYKLDHPEKSVFYEPNNIWLNDRYPFAHASLDGWIKDEADRFGVLEIKTTEVMSGAAAAKWKDQIPENYFCQLLHYFLVTEAKFAELRALIKFMSHTELRDYHIERDEVEDDITYLRGEEEKFAEYIKADRCPDLIFNF